LSYSISISGHKNVADQEEGRVFEEDIAAKAREFVASLEGVSSAYGSFQNLGSVNLQEEGS
jgi:hypothetical protein